MSHAAFIQIRFEEVSAEKPQSQIDRGKSILLIPVR